MGFWDKKDRQNAYLKALEMGFEPVICYIYAPDDILISRISQRKGTIAEYNRKNFNNIKQMFEVPDDDEFFIRIDNY